MTSIIVITYNRSQLLSKTLKSILNQTHKEFELIVVDDGSNDDTEKLINELKDNRIRYFNFGKIGNLSRLRNLGIKHATYDYIAFCDDDDLWYSDKLSKQLSLMKKYNFVCSNADMIDFEGNVIKGKYFPTEGADFEIDKKYLLKSGNIILTSAVLLKKSILSDNDCLFDEEKHTNYCEDYELFLRISRFTNIFFSSESLIQKRIHGSVSGGLDNNIKMLGRSIEILSQYRDKDEALDKLPIEGILGFKILIVKKAFEKNLTIGAMELLRFMRFTSNGRVLKVFINTKVKNKLSKFFEGTH